MQKTLVLYASLKGESLKVAEHAMHRMRERGLSVRHVDVRMHAESFMLSNYAAVLMVASAHGSFHPREMVRFASLHRELLAKMPARLLSLSLYQAGVEAQEGSPERRARAEARVRHATDLFCKATGFDPRRVVPIAGSLRYLQCGPFKRQLMRLSARRFGLSTDVTRDHEYTRLANVDAVVDAFCDEQAGGRVGTTSHGLV